MGTEDGGDDGRQRGTGEVPPAQGHPGAMVTVGGSCLPPPGTRIAAVPNRQTAGSGEQRGSQLVSANEAAPTPSPQHGDSLPAAPPPRDPPYLSMMTGSEGVSLRFPQLFLSQQRLGTRGGHEGGVWVQPQHSTPTPQPPHDGERGSCPIGRVLGCGWGHRHGWSRLGTRAARCHSTGVGGPPPQPPPMTSGPDLGSLGTGLQWDPAAQGSPQPHTSVTPWGRGTAPIGTR